MSRLAVVERAIADAPTAGFDLNDIAARAGFADGGARQLAPLAWWLAHTGRVRMSRDCTRFRPTAQTCPLCGIETQPSIYGRRALCLPCTEDELGESYEDIRDRATKRVQGTARKKWRVVE